MPKIVLTNSKTGKLEEFEPVDAREILADKSTIYTVPQSTHDEIGMRHDPNSDDVNVPQLQGDPEMQTGLSIDKYGRSAVVKAQVGQPRAATTTQGEPIVEESADASSMSKAQLQEALSQRGTAYPSSATKAELQALYDGK